MESPSPNLRIFLECELLAATKSKIISSFLSNRSASTFLLLQKIGINALAASIIFLGVVKKFNKNKIRIYRC